jgi:hypothetical protein
MESPKKILIPLIAVIFPALALGGSSAGNGGDTVSVPVGNDASYHQLYSLDLDEYGVASDPAVEIQKANLNPYAGQAVLPGYSVFSMATNAFGGENCPDPILNGQGVCLLWYFDHSQQDTLKMLATANPDLFGTRSLSSGDGDDGLDGRDRVATGLANKLYRIRQVLPEYADRLVAEFQSLTWIVTNAPLAKTDDVSSPLADEAIYQIARNDNSVIRITHQGWDRNVVETGLRHEALDYGNRMAVITHEILYAIALQQGDKDSRRARQANAYLYMKRDSDEFIRKSYDVLFPSH